MHFRKFFCFGFLFIVVLTTNAQAQKSLLCSNILGHLIHSGSWLIEAIPFYKSLTSGYPIAAKNEGYAVYKSDFELWELSKKNGWLEPGEWTIRSIGKPDMAISFVGGFHSIDPKFKIQCLNSLIERFVKENGGHSSALLKISEIVFTHPHPGNRTGEFDIEYHSQRFSIYDQRTSKAYRNRFNDHPFLKHVKATFRIIYADPRSNSILAKSYSFPAGRKNFHLPYSLFNKPR